MLIFILIYNMYYKFTSIQGVCSMGIDFSLLRILFQGIITFTNIHSACAFGMQTEIPRMLQNIHGNRPFLCLFDTNTIGNTVYFFQNTLSKCRHGGLIVAV